MKTVFLGDSYVNVDLMMDGFSAWRGWPTLFSEVLYVQNHQRRNPYRHDRGPEVH